MRACTRDDDGHGGRDRPHGWPRPHPRRLADEGRGRVTRRSTERHDRRVATSPSTGTSGMNTQRAFGRAVAARLPGAELVQVRMRATGIAGATADGAGLSLLWMTTKGPSFASDLVRP